MEELQKIKTAAKLEALLFIYGEPMDIKKIDKILAVKEAEVEEALNVLEENLKQDIRGLFIIRDKNKVQLATKPEFSEFLKEIAKQEFAEPLTPAALETLAIVAYTGPVTRADIEYVRGVNSSFILRALLMRGLIERQTDSKRANAYLYSASFELLRQFGLDKNENLQDYAKYKELVKHFHEQLAENQNKQSLNDEQPSADNAGL